VCEVGSDFAAASHESVGEAMSMVLAGLRRLAEADMSEVPVSVRAECLRQLERAKSVQTAAQASVLRAFDRDRGFEEDGQGSSRTWLTWQTGVTKQDASASIGWMRRLRDHPLIAEALKSAKVSASLARWLCQQSDRVPGNQRGETDQILLDAALAGLGLRDLAGLIDEILARLAEPDSDGNDGFDDRAVWLATSMGAGRMTGDLTPQCAEALQAVLDALGKKMGPEDTRTAAQRHHDALAEACRRLIASGCLPDRAGQPTQIQLHLSLDELLRRLGETSGGPVSPVPQSPTASPGDECDAAFVPVVTGCLDPELLDRLVAGSAANTTASNNSAANTSAANLRDVIVANAAALFSGPRGLASWLRRREFCGVAGSISLPLDTGSSTDNIPVHLRRAVILRDRHCAAPGCDQPPAACQVHHLKPRKSGGLTKLSNLLLLCSFHHLIVVHRWGWTITLNPNGTTTMTSPDGARTYYSHSPPAAA
jgi:hypothetical protein